MKKKLFAILFILTLILSLSVAHAEYVTLITPAPAVPQLTLRPSDDEVKVFANPSTKANIVGYIIVGGRQEVNVLSVQNEWVRVSFTSIHGLSEGWIPLSCFQAPVTPTPTPVPVKPLGNSAFVCNPQKGYRLNLRATASATATSLGKYYTGAPVTLTGESRNGYLRVTIGSVSGWVDARFLTNDPYSFTSELPQVYVVNPGSGANLRAGASTSATRIGWYPHGTTITILGVRADEWYHVAVGGQTGYMSCTLLSQNFPWQIGGDSDAPSVSGDVVVSGATMYVTGSSGAHLRSSASASARSLGVFYGGCPVTVLSYTRTGWTYVRIGQLTGYIDTGCLSATRPNRTGQVRTIINPYGSGLNLRDMPTTASNVLVLCRNYSTVTVLGDLTDDWCFVIVGGQYGYMMGTRLVP